MVHNLVFLSIVILLKGKEFNKRFDINIRLCVINIIFIIYFNIYLTSYLIIQSTITMYNDIHKYTGNYTHTSMVISVLLYL